MNPKHKKVKKNHSFERKTLKLLEIGWRYIHEGEELINKGKKIIDHAIVREMLEQRRSDR